MSIFENIKVIATDRGWTVKKVAEKAGIGEATISYIDGKLPILLLNLWKK